MSSKRFTPEQTIGTLLEAEVTLSQGRTAAQVCRALGLAEPTFSPWGRKYAGLTVKPGTSLQHFCGWLLLMRSARGSGNVSLSGSDLQIVLVWGSRVR